MATTRIKDISSTVTSLASDDYIAVDGATNGTRKMVRSSIYTDVAAAFTGAPTTYDICPLNSGTNKIDATYLPTSGDTPKGEWNASTNSPSLSDGTGTAGDYYDVTTAGSQDLGSGSITFTVGDVVKYNGSTWYKIDSVANFLDGYSTAAASRAALEVNSIDEDAQAYALKTTAPALYFNGTSSVVTVADDDKFSFTDGTDDLPFTISAFVNMTDASSFGICTKYVNSGQYEWAFWVDGSDNLVFRLTENTDIGDYSQIKSDATVTAYEGQWIHVAASYAGAGPTAASGNDFSAAASGMALYINGSAIAATGSNVDYPGMTAGSDPVIIGKILGSFSEGSVRDVKIFNRELTSTEIAELARGNDLGFSEEWAGAHGAVYTSDFSNPDVGGDEDLDGWVALSNITLTGNIDAIDGQNDNLRLATDATSGQHSARINTLTAGKRHRVSLDYYIPSGQSNIDGFRVRLGSGGDLSDVTATLDSWTRHEFEGVCAAASGLLLIYATDGGALSFQDAGGDDVMYISNVKVTEIGTLADFRAEQYDTNTSKLYDLSDNAFVGTGTSVTLTGREVPVYETGTWTPTLTFGGGSTGLTYTSQEGFYTRIGNTVFATGGLILSAKGSSTGSAKIALPYTARNTTDDIQGVSVGRGLNMSGLTSAVTGYVVDNTTSCQLMDWGATGAVDLDEGNFTDTTEINISVTYQIS